MTDPDPVVPVPVPVPVPGPPVPGAPLPGPLVPGEVLLAEGPVPLASPTVELVVVNRGDRPVQVGSHYHFAEANDALEFDREAAWGMRLCVPAGTAVRFEPNVARTVGLVDLAGARRVPGLRSRAAGPLDGGPTR